MAVSYSQSGCQHRLLFGGRRSSNNTCHAAQIVKQGRIVHYQVSINRVPTLHERFCLCRSRVIMQLSVVWFVSTFAGVGLSMTSIRSVSRPWLTIAGLSGLSAVALGTYGAHAFQPADDHYVSTFETANKYHFIHSLLIGLAPVARCLPVRAYSL